MKRYNFHVTGCSHYEKAFDDLAISNHVYNWTNKELLESYEDGDRIYEYSYYWKDIELVPEPNNRYDPNAVAVRLHGKKIGYIKAGACTQVKNLLASEDFQRIELREMVYGNYKEIEEDDNERLVVSEGFRNPYAEISIVIGQEEEKPQKRKKKKSAAMIACIVIGAIIFLAGLLLLLASPVTGIIIMAVAVAIMVYARIYYGGRK